MKENRRTPVIAMRAAAVLLVLVVMTTSIVSGRYARYTTSATASDSARVAKYEVRVTPSTGDALTLNPNNADKTASYTFSVTSGSEVAVEYDLIVVLPAALQEGITLSLAQGSSQIDLELDDKTNTYKAVKAGTFTPTGGTHEYTLTFTATQPIGADKLENIAIRVDARQVD